MLSAKCWPFCKGLNVIIRQGLYWHFELHLNSLSTLEPLKIWPLHFSSMVFNYKTLSFYLSWETTSHWRPLLSFLFFFSEYMFHCTIYLLQLIREDHIFKRLVKTFTYEPWVSHDFVVVEPIKECHWEFSTGNWLSWTGAALDTYEN